MVDERLLGGGRGAVEIAGRCAEQRATATRCRECPRPVERATAVRERGSKTTRPLDLVGRNQRFDGIRQRHRHRPLVHATPFPLR